MDIQQDDALFTKFSLCIKVFISRRKPRKRKTGLLAHILECGNLCVNLFKLVCYQKYSNGEPVFFGMAKLSLFIIYVFIFAAVFMDVLAELPPRK